jgi:hypothetical protein
MDRPSVADLARIRAEHAADGPSDVALLLAELDWQIANRPLWQGRRHVSPVPHLAGVAYGLMGPATAEELAR